MVASARVAYLARRAADYGVEVGPVAVDMKRVRERKRAIVISFREAREKKLAMAHVELIRGEASFTGQRQIRVSLHGGGERQLSAAQIFIDTGTHSGAPPIEGLDGVPYLNNETVMELDHVPKHLLILGGGYIGVEFSQMFRRFGSEVTILERRSRLVPNEDQDVSVAMKEFLEAEGIDIRLNATSFGFSKESGNVIARGDGLATVSGSHVLIATGRRPNTDDLGLENAGVKTNERGFIEVDDQLRTSVPGIWALGDCNGRGAFTHTSYNDFEIVAANLLDNDPRRVSDRIVTYAIYTDPPLGRAGMTEAEVRKTGKPAQIGNRPMTKVGRAVEKGETYGFMKILIDAETKLILGAAILGTGGDEAVHSILDVMYARAPYTVIQRAVHIHPTVCELIPTMLGELKPL